MGETHDRFEADCLACPIPSEQADDFPPVDLEAQVLERRHAGKILSDGLDAEPSFTCLLIRFVAHCCYAGALCWPNHGLDTCDYCAVAGIAQMAVRFFRFGQ